MWNQQFIFVLKNYCLLGVQLVWTGHNTNVQHKARKLTSSSYQAELTLTWWSKAVLDPSMKETRSCHFNGRCSINSHEYGQGKLSRNAANNTFNGLNDISIVGSTLNGLNTMRIVTWSSKSIAKWSRCILWQQHFRLWHDMNWSKSFAWTSSPIAAMWCFVSISSMYPMAFCRCLQRSPVCNHSNIKPASATVSTLTNWRGENVDCSCLNDHPKTVCVHSRTCPCLQLTWVVTAFLL